MKKKLTQTFLEGLEPRIAPAGLFTFTDVDGDVVTVKTSKGSNTDLANALTISDAGQLEKVDFTSQTFEHTTLDIKVKTRDIHGDGLVNVGLIDASGIDINATSVKGDLGKILAGDNKKLSAHNGVVSLSVQSLGAMGLSTQGEGETDLNSVIFGRSNYLKVATSITDASIIWTSPTLSPPDQSDVPISHTGLASVKAITVGGNYNGGDGVRGNGYLYVDGEIGNFKLGGNLYGGDGERSGSIFADSFGSLTIGGSLNGGNGNFSASLYSAHGATSIKIGGSMNGEGENSASIILEDAAGGLISVGGSLKGGEGDDSGQIAILGGGVSSVTIGGSVVGGFGADSGVITNHDTTDDNTDKPAAPTVTNIGALKIGGSLIGSLGDESGMVWVDKVGSINVGGNIIGGGFEDHHIEEGEAQYSGDIWVDTATSIFVGGNITGGDQAYSGIVHVSDDIKSFQLKGNLAGGDGSGSGVVELASALGSKTASVIGGSVIGGNGEDQMLSKLGSGAVYLDGNGTHTLAINGRVQGGSADNSGMIVADTNVSSLIIGGSVLGGSGDNSGVLRLTGDFHEPRTEDGPINNVTLQTLSIGEAVYGGGGEDSGAVTVNNVTNLKVGGDVYGNKGDNSGVIYGNTITAASIGGSVIGGEGENSGSISYINGSSFSLDGSIIGNTDDSGEGNGRVEISSITSVNISGSILGGFAEDSGTLSLGGKSHHPNGESEKNPTNPVTITIGGDIVGSEGDGSGLVSASPSIGIVNMTVGGSVTGGEGEQSGSLQLGQVSSLAIGGDVTGGSGEDSGSIFLRSHDDLLVKQIIIGGSLIGGTYNGTGSLLAYGSHVGLISIGGDVVGGSNENVGDPGQPGDPGVGQPGDPDYRPPTGGTPATPPDSVQGAGFITAGIVDKFYVGGSLLAGQSNSEAENDLNLGAVRATSFGSFTVDGSIQGNEGNQFLITGKGNLVSGKTKTNLAFGSIEVGGDVDYATILAGYDTEGTTIDGDGGELGGTAQIGNVHVGGDWYSSSLAAGVDQGRGEDPAWGSSRNHLLTKPEGSSLIASIASIVIDGRATGGEEVLNGFVAEKIGSLTVADSAYTIPPAPDFVQVGSNENLVARLVTQPV